MEKKIKVCHFTSAHGSLDDRIFIKECVSLAKHNYEVHIVAKGQSFEKDGVFIDGVGEMPESRIKRMLWFSKMIYEKALSLDCDIYHFHDPELLKFALRLKKRGKKVIFDSHEDVPAQILDKEWIPGFARRIISFLYKRYETRVARQIDAVVAATPYIAGQFEKRARKVEVINNYPILDDVIFHDNSFSEREPVVCYAGGISTMRGEQIMLKAIEGVDGKLILAGPHPETENNPAAAENVEYLGFVDRNAINELYGKSVAGLCVLLPAKNYVNSQPIKIFEYMAAGLPFVASDFPLWKNIGEKYNCGLFVPANDPTATQEKIEYLLNNRELAQQMGKNGYAAVQKEYNWKKEEEKLLGLYRVL